jgi:hypothetical protein
MGSVELSDEQARHLATQTVFFGHQSVGDNIVQGVRDLMVEDRRLHLNIINSAYPGGIAGPAFVETHIGENTRPDSKNDAFRAIIDKGLGARGGIAIMKYCYVDIGPDTDISSMFQNYADLVSHLKAKYPALKIVHVTVPLTTVEPAGKAWLKGLLGKPTARADNVKRNQFNQLLKETYESRTIFDLAQVESTHADGSREYFLEGKQKVYVLTPEYTIDGGHLNEIGRHAAAQRLLITLSTL